MAKRDAMALGIMLLVGAVAFLALTAFTGNNGQLMSGVVLLLGAVVLLAIGIFKEDQDDSGC